MPDAVAHGEQYEVGHQMREPIRAASNGRSRHVGQVAIVTITAGYLVFIYETDKYSASVVRVLIRSLVISTGALAVTVVALRRGAPRALAARVVGAVAGFATLGYFYATDPDKCVDGFCGTNRLLAIPIEMLAFLAVIGRRTPRTVRNGS